MRRTAIRASLLSVLVVGAFLSPASAAPGDPSSGPSDSPVTSANGRYVAFVSAADNLLGGDPSADSNGVEDVFVLDTQTDRIELISYDHTGNAQANGASTEVDISADGRYVAFVSEATNLLAGDANGSLSDVFVFDRQTGAMTLASRRGVSGAQGDQSSWNVSISNDGTKVAFTSFATNLVGSDTNKLPDAFVRDLVAGTTTRVSTSSSGKQANAGTLSALISANGGTVAFSSSASNLVNKDLNGKRDVFVKVLSTGKTLRVSVSDRETEAKGTSNLHDLSSNGRYVVFSSDAANLVGGDTNAVSDVFVRDRTGGTTVRVSRRGSTEANGASYGAAIAPDGSYVAFTSTATNLGGALEDTNGTAADVFEWDMAASKLRLVSIDATGGWGDGPSFDPYYGSGSVLAFASMASDLVTGDVNGYSDVFLRTWAEGRLGGNTELVSFPAPAA